MTNVFIINAHQEYPFSAGGFNRAHLEVLFPELGS